MTENANKDRKAILSMLRAMRVKPHSTSELAAITGWNERTVRIWLDMLREMRMAFVGEYRKDGIGRYTVAAYSFGFDQADVPKPAAQTGAQRTAKYKQRGAVLA